MAKQLYDYWFVQFDFPNEDGKPYKSSGGAMVYNERLKRDVPVGWQVENLIEFAEIKNGATPSTTDDANYGGDIVWIFPILVVGANEAYKQWIELQDEIANKQFVLTKEIAVLTKQRDELLPLLMNGQAVVNSD